MGARSLAPKATGPVPYEILKGQSVASIGQHKGGDGRTDICTDAHDGLPPEDFIGYQPFAANAQEDMQRT